MNLKTAKAMMEHGSKAAPQQSPIDADIAALLAMDAEIKARCEASYLFFFRAAWPILQPQIPLIWNWHVDYLCDELQKQCERIARREPKKYDLLINISPRSLKSTICTVLFPVWAWIIDPTQKFMCWSYEEKLSTGHAVESRRVIQSDFFQRNWGDRFRLTGDQNTKSYYQNDKSGMRMSTSFGGRGTGSGGNYNIIDDPHNAIEAGYASKRQIAIDTFTQAINSRLNDPDVDMRIIVMQRLHEDDLSGYILKNMGNQYRHICIPADDSVGIYPPELKKFYVNGLFFPARFHRTRLDNELKTMKAYAYGGQFLQQPSPPEGGLFDKKAWVFWTPKGTYYPPPQLKVGSSMVTCKVVELPKKFDRIISSWDATFKNFSDSDFVSGTVNARLGANQFLLDRYNDRADFTKTAEAMVEQEEKWSAFLSRVIVEDKANGPAIVSHLKGKIPKLHEVTPHGSKFARAQPLADMQHSGQVILPHPAIASWVLDVIEQFSMFPHGRNDDDVDSISQAQAFLFATRRVWPKFELPKSDPIINFLDNEKAFQFWVSVWAEGGRTSAVISRYDTGTGQLVAFAEAKTDTPDAPSVASAVKAAVLLASNGVHKNIAKYSWVGNAGVFAGPPNGNLAFSYQQLGIFVQKNIRFNLDGHIAEAGKMFSVGKAVVSSRCRDLAAECGSWDYTQSGPQKGQLLALALANLSGMLYETTSHKQTVPLKPYSAKKTGVLQALDKLSAQGKYGQRALVAAGRPVGSARTESASGMV